MSNQESDEKTILKCDKHSEIIGKKLLNLYQNKELFDTTLVAGSDSVIIQVHSVVLYSLSEYFLDIFREKQKGVSDNSIELKDIEASALKDVINFMYTGTIEISLGTAEKYLRIGLKLNIPTLVECCSELIEKRINSKNCLHWFRIAYELCVSSLMTKSMENIYIHFEEWQTKKEFLTLGTDEIKDLLFNYNPYGDFEECIFLTMIEWIDHDKTQRESLILELLQLVRFWKLTPNFLIKNRLKVCKTVESYELLCSWLEWHLLPETRFQKQQFPPLKSRKGDSSSLIAPVLGTSTHTLNSEQKDGQNDHLEVVRLTNTGVIRIHELNDKKWSLKNVIESPVKNRIVSMILINDKIILNRQTGFGNEIVFLEMQTFKMHSVTEMRTMNLEFCQFINLNGELCLYGPDRFTRTFYFEIYNFPTKKWRQITLPHGSDLLSFRHVTANSENLLLIGNDRLCKYDLFTKTWSFINIITIPGFNHCVATEENILYNFGDEKYLRFNWKSKTLLDCKRIPINISDGKYFCLNKTIIISDGNKVVEIDTKADYWRILSSLPLELKNSAFVFTVKKK